MTLVDLVELIKKRIVLVIAIPLITALVVGIWSLTRPDVYTASTTMYVLAKVGSNNDAFSQSDLNASQMLANDVATIAESARVKREVGEKVDVELSRYPSTVSSANNTRVLTLRVTGPEAEKTAQVANAYANTVSKVAAETMNLEAVNIIDEASVPTSPSGPHRLRYALLGFVAGLFAALVAVVLMDVLNTRIRNSSDVEELLDVPVVGHFPEV